MTTTRSGGGLLPTLAALKPGEFRAFCKLGHKVTRRGEYLDTTVVLPETCDRSFSDRAEYESHMVKAHGSKLYPNRSRITPWKGATRKAFTNTGHPDLLDWPGRIPVAELLAGQRFTYRNHTYDVLAVVDGGWTMRFPLKDQEGFVPASRFPLDAVVELVAA